MTLKSRSAETLPPVLTGVEPQRFFDVMPLLIFTLIACAPISLVAQKSSGRHMRVRSQPSKTQSQGPQILFDYYPSALFSNPVEAEQLFVAIAKDGRTQAVRYGFHNPVIIGVYEGKLPQAEVARLLAKSRLAIPKASEVNRPYIGSCDAESFRLSLAVSDGTGNQTVMQNPACLPPMPEDIMGLVAELRAIWRRLNQSPLAHGYLRSFVFEKDFLKSPHRNIKEFISIGKFPPRLRAIVRKVSTHSTRFYPIDQVQFRELRALEPVSSHFFVIDKGNHYSLALYLSSNASHAPPQEE